MRITMAAAAGVAVFFGTACGSSGNPGDTTGDQGSTGSASATTGGSGTTSGGNGAGTSNGTTTGTSGQADGTACTSDDACLSGVCGLNGTGNCCSTSCKTDEAACAATACDNTGACTYPTDGAPCNSTCQYGLFTSYKCGGGACSPADPLPCPNNLACNAAGTACAGTCDPANGTADCALGWYCAGSTCTPQTQLGACTSNSECQSNVCGVTGTGHCCTQSACSNVNSASNPCGTLDCDGATGSCTFPPASTVCDTGAISCKTNAAGVNVNVQLDPNTTCDGTGTCQAPIETDCSPYACESLGCVTSCNSIADCAKDFWCSNGTCIPQQAVGACSQNDTCLSLQCGGSGVGHCCFQNCGSTDPSCGISDCDAVNGSCEYPGAATACSDVLESCTAGVQQNPSVCDGAGNCPVPGTTPCTPFVCGATACKTSCQSNADCAVGASCATSAGICCPAILSGGSINVDGQNGSDAAACCGSAGNQECQTIGFAMSLIDAAQAKNVTINAYLGGAGNGGDWPFLSVGSYYAYNQPAAGDQVPIRLGWGVELNAPGVNFAPNWGQYGEDCDFDSYNNCGTALPEIFDIVAYSANDTVGYVSITGNTSIGNVQVGVAAAGAGSSYNDAAVRVEKGQHLYLANATLANYYAVFQNAYIRNYVRYAYGAGVVLSPGGNLTFASDQSGAVTGQVVLGSTSSNNGNFWGCRGLVCETDGLGAGCTVDDVPLDGGVSSVIIANNYLDDIEANDFANITLKGSPQIGNAPASQGFKQCSNKVDGQAEVYDYSTGQESYEQNMIWLNGQATMSLSNATIGCGSGAAFYLNASPNGNGNPALSLTGSTIQNTAAGVYASAGTVTAKKTSITYNGAGVIQDTDGTNTASIDLSGGGNTVACTSGAEGGPNVNPYDCSEGYGNYYCPEFGTAAAVVNRSGSDLDADNVVWDTKGPDFFACDDNTLSSCTCQNTSCTATAGADGMDAVTVSTGSIDVAGATTTTLDCTAPISCFNYGYCPSGEICADYYQGEFYECTTEANCLDEPPSVCQVYKG